MLDLAYDETSARASRKGTSREVRSEEEVYSGRQARGAKGNYEIGGQIEVEC